MEGTEPPLEAEPSVAMLGRRLDPSSCYSLQPEAHRPMQLNVLLASDQVRGIDGTGGLGDVTTALAKELARRKDIDIRIIMPGYQQAAEKLPALFADVVIPDLRVPMGEDTVSVQVCRYLLPQIGAASPRVPVYLLVQPQVFARRENSGPQAVLLARATLEFIAHSTEFQPDLIHCNDWHTGLIPVYIESLYRQNPTLGRMATLYTTHNNTGEAYQGAHPFYEVQHLCGLPSDSFLPGQTRSLEHFGRFNFAKGGFGFADLVNTVSIRYAAELQSRAFGGRLEQVLRDRGQDLCGIVNGIDVEEWDPAGDEFLPAECRFSADDSLAQIRTSKLRIRERLRQWRDPATGAFPFEKLRPDSLLIGVVTRITDQKMPVMLPLREDTGFDYEIPSPLERICRDVGDVQFVILGSADRNDWRGLRYAQRLAELGNQLPDQLLFFDGFSIELSHLIYAGSEMFLVPSVFEPCGLTQLTSMRYGGVPVVRSVGGLRDTVIDERAGHAANGFTFCEFEGPVEEWTAMVDVPRAAELLYHTLRRAIEIYHHEVRWEQLVRNGMRRDSSWKVPAAQYRKLYETAVARRVGRWFSVPSSLDAMQQRLDDAVKRLELVLTIPPTMYWNLAKLATGAFGPFEMTGIFRVELQHLRELGYITAPPLEQIPDRGDNLSHFVQITDAGREFVLLREALKQSLMG